jgi:hypothetical protein
MKGLVLLFELFERKLLLGMNHAAVYRALFGLPPSPAMVESVWG